MAYVNFLKLVTGVITQHDDSLSTTDDLRVRHMDVTGDLTVSGSEIIVGSTTFRGNVNLGDSTDDIVTITSSGTILTGDGVLTLDGLASDKLLWSDSGTVKNTDLSGWVADFGSANISVADDGSGGITLDTAQDIASGDSPTFAGLTVTNAITEFSTDGTLAGDSDSALPTEKAVKLYVDTATTTLSGSMDHGGLLGLGDDDHTQYILVDGTRAFTGNVQANASGTLDIGSSGTPFANLYADDVYVKGFSLHIGDNVELTEFAGSDLGINQNIYLSRSNGTTFYQPSGSDPVIFKLAGTSGAGRFMIQDSAAGDAFRCSSDGSLDFYGEAELHYTGGPDFRATTNTDVSFKLGDAAGAYKFIWLDSASAEVASVDSNGNILASGTIGWDNVTLSEYGNVDLSVNSDIRFTNANPIIYSTSGSDSFVFRVAANQKFEWQSSAQATVMTLSDAGAVSMYGDLSFIGGEYGINAAADNDLPIHMGDSAGLYKVSFEDWTGAEVAWIDSLGNASFTSISGTIISDGSVDHGSLGGLSDDDHTQYLLADGTRALTGNWNAGNFDVIVGGDLTASGTLTAGGTTPEVQFSATSGTIGVSGNTDLIQLTGTDVTFDADILFTISGTYDIGTSAIPVQNAYFDDIYVKGSSIHLGDTVELTESSSELAVNTNMVFPADKGLKSTSASNLYMALGDNAGVNTISFRDSDGAEVAWIDSNGNASFAGDVNISGSVSGTQDHAAMINLDYASAGHTGFASSSALTSHTGDATIHFTEASIDHGSIAGLGDDDHTQYILADGSRAMTANWNMGNYNFIAGGDITASGSFIAGGASSSIEFSATSGTIGVSGDTDLIQLSSTGSLGSHSADFYLDSAVTVEFDGAVYFDGAVSMASTLGFTLGTTINELSIDGTLAGDSDDAVPTEKAVKAYVDAQTTGSGISDHGNLLGLADDDHAQYHTDGRADTWFTGKDLASLGTKEHHDLDGLGDDDHTQYSLVDGTRAFSSTVGGVTPVADADLATKGYVDSIAVAPDEMTVTSGVNTVVGSVLYVSGNDTVNLADKDDASATKVIGLATAVVNGDGSETANVQADGILIGALVAATAGTRYYLSDDGALSSSPPSETGDYVVLIGIAANATDLFVRIGDAILL